MRHKVDPLPLATGPATHEWKHLISRAALESHKVANITELVDALV